MKIQTALFLFTRLIVLALCASSLPAVTILQFSGGTIASSGEFGLQLTTPAGGPWDAITFSFFSDSTDTTASAAGTAYIFSSQYSGTPGGLSSAGALATGAASSGAYVFSPSFTLQSSTTYYLYEDTSITVDENQSGGAFFGSGGSTPFATTFKGPLNFRLSGSTVPEPASLSLLLTGIGFGSLGVLACRRR